MKSGMLAIALTIPTQAALAQVVYYSAGHQMTRQEVGGDPEIIDTGDHDTWLEVRVDSVSGKVYMRNGLAELWQMNLDGSNLEQVFPYVAPGFDLYVPQPNSVPTRSDLGLAVLGLSILITATITLRNRKPRIERG